ncbi:MAG TPA: hypothetical protein VI790_03485 [Candidatus Nanoarchaeia archaeon]|nr:hypothetical protein [Candidatus Nanoarchaeia archaeon]
MVDDVKKKVDVTRETIEELGEQIKGMLEGVSANIDDYRFTVTSKKDGLEIEFYIKADIKKSKKK